jgi:Na+-translocating ferredoxin:NAD+ oxidoreductase RnfG subunit
LTNTHFFYILKTILKFEFIMYRFLFVVFLALVLPLRALAIEYMTKEEALKLAFPSADTAASEKKEVPTSVVSQIESLWGKKQDANYKIYIGKKGEEVQGYAMFLTRGTKYQPITFMVKISASGKVDLVSIIVYREPRGEEVKETRFLKQFFGKTSKDKVELNRDITAVAGATVSAEVVTAGVKEALYVIDALYLTKLATKAP